MRTPERRQKLESIKQVYYGGEVVRTTESKRRNQTRSFSLNDHKNKVILHSVKDSSFPEKQGASLDTMAVTENGDKVSEDLSPRYQNHSREWTINQP
jgi:hypothetical protein